MKTWTLVVNKAQGTVKVSGSSIIVRRVSTQQVLGTDGPRKHVIDRWPLCYNSLNPYNNVGLFQQNNALCVAHVAQNWFVEDCEDFKKMVWLPFSLDTTLV